MAPVWRSVYGLRLLADPRLRRMILITLAVILVGYRLFQFAVFTTGIGWGYDFSFYWRAGRALLAGEAIYSAEQLSGPYAPQGQNGFLYPPPFAAAATPFAVVFPTDYRAAAWGWAALGALILVATILTVARSEGLQERVRTATGLGPWILVAAAIGFPPVIGELVLGNVNLVLLGLLGAAWLGVRAGTARGERLAGVAVGLAAVIKVFPGLILLWFLVTRRWQGAAFVLVGALGVAILALPLTGIQPWLDYPTVLANLSAPSITADALAPTIWLAEVIGFLPARIVVTAVVVTLVGWSALRAPTRMSFTVAVLASMLVAPALYQRYLVILVLPFLLLLAEGRSIAWLAAAYVLMSGGEQPALGDLAWIVNRAMPTAGALLLLVLALRPTRRCPAVQAVPAVPPAGP